MNKITCICLGVRNMEKAVHFYRDDLGFRTNETDPSPAVIFFDTPGTKFELFPVDALVHDINDPALHLASGFSGVTLAYNVAKKEDVDTTVHIVEKAGGRIVKQPQATFWGGYHAYFKDLDNYYWEISWGPNFKYDENGLLLF